MHASILTRRDFAAALGGIVLSFSLGPQLATGQQSLPGSLQGNPMLDAWLRINADGTITVFTGKVELGQGIVTALAQIAAEELGVPLEKIRMLPASTAYCPDEGVTSGSLSIQDGGKGLRKACAELRALLQDRPKLTAV